MTTELEKNFFKCFEIEPKHNDGCKIADKYWDNEELANKYGTFDNYMDKNCVEENSGACFSTCEFAYDDKQYPPITDRKLLLLVCLANAHSIYGYSDYGGEFLIGTTIEELKENLLKDLLDNASRVREDVKALFEE